VKEEFNLFSRHYYIFHEVHEVQHVTIHYQKKGNFQLLVFSVTPHMKLNKMTLKTNFHINKNRWE